MLERRRLLLRPWSVAVGPTIANCGSEVATRLVRPIVDADSGQELGRACRASAHFRAWRRWLGEAVLVVYETQDDALVFTLHHGLGWRRPWEVRDADDHPVAAFRRGILRDGFGRWAAVVERLDDSTRGRFRDGAGVEIASWCRSSDGTALAFAPGVADNPFFKMALLGALLVLEDSARPHPEKA